MEKYQLKDDIKTFYVTARSFPDGIMEAFQTLEKLHPTIIERPCFGLSYKNNNGDIVYKAAAPERYEGEGQKYGCETFTIPKGEYLTETITNWMEKKEVIKDTFQKLLADPRLDTTFPCVEWYKSDDEVMCMIKTDPSKG